MIVGPLVFYERKHNVMCMGHRIKDSRYKLHVLYVFLYGRKIQYMYFKCFLSYLGNFRLVKQSCQCYFCRTNLLTK